MPRLFGTNGIRGVVNEDMNVELALNLGKAIGTYLDGGRVAVGTDTRTSNEILKGVMISGLLSTGLNVVDLGIVPTPVLQYHVKRSDIQHGVVITASHNPPEFNGIKCVDSDGTELSRQKEESLEDIFFKREFKKISWNIIGHVQRDTNSIEHYIYGITKIIEADPIISNQPKVVLDGL